MSETVRLFFIVRTDVTADSGLQRAFGVAEDLVDAKRARDEIAANRQGVFVVFEGAPYVDEEIV